MTTSCSIEFRLPVAEFCGLGQISAGFAGFLQPGQGNLFTASLRCTYSGVWIRTIALLLWERTNDRHGYKYRQLPSSISTL